MLEKTVTDYDLDEVYDSIEELMKSRDFGKISDELERIIIPESPTDILIGYLTVTLPVKSMIVFRPKFYRQVEEELKTRKGYDSEILQGLR